MYRASSVVLTLKIYRRVACCTFFPSGMIFFYLVIRGWNFTSAYYVRIESINIRRYIERHHVRACVNDVPKIKIGKNQNKIWGLIGRGSKTS